MNADQVIEGIGKVVAAAKPAQEYCLLWSDYWWWMCMTKAEWSGWAQAIGSIVALLMAAALPYIQGNYRRARTYVAANNALLQLVAIYAAIQMKVQAGADARQVLNAANPNLDSGFRAFDIVRVDELPSACWPAWWSARANATQLQGLHTSLGPNAGAVIVLGKLEATAKSLLEEFSKHEPSLLGFRIPKAWRS